MLRRLLMLMPLLVAFWAVSASASPPGPRLLILKLKAPERTELLTVDPLGGAPQTLLRAGARKVPAVYPFASAAWTPDGTRVVFTALVGQERTKYSTSPRTMLASIGADGGEVKPVPATARGFAPVVSPDGRSVAFAKNRRRLRPNGHGGADEVYRSTSIWLAGLVSGGSRQLTPWRNRLVQVPSSFSPDGNRLAFTRQVADKPPEALAMEFNGSADSVLARNALEPVYSPDGSRIAFLRGPVQRRRSESGMTVARLTDLYVMNAGGGGLKRLTLTANMAEETPSWDLSGQRLAYSRLKPFGSEGSLLGFGNSVMEINADGTCATKVLSERFSILAPGAWQPGPGREAGPIAC